MPDENQPQLSSEDRKYVLRMYERACYVGLAAMVGILAITAGTLLGSMYLSPGSFKENQVKVSERRSLDSLVQPKADENNKDGFSPNY